MKIKDNLTLNHSNMDRAFEEFILSSGKIENLSEENQKILTIIAAIDKKFAVKYAHHKKNEMMMRELKTAKKKKK